MRKLHDAAVGSDDRDDEGERDEAAAGDPRDGVEVTAGSHVAVEPAPGASRSRRGLLLGGAAALATGAAGAAGVALGYRFRTELRDVKLRAQAYPLDVPGEVGAFRHEAEQIVAQRDRQTADEVRALKARYENAVFGKVRVWDMIEKLALCIDASDMRLFCASQLVHAQQVYAAMRENGVDDPDMLLLALIHDLGKVMLLAHEAPANVVGITKLVAAGSPGAGLDDSVFQFGHGEFVYSRVKDHVPEHVAWISRWHNVRSTEAEPLMSAREQEWDERWLRPFRRFDGRFVSPYFLPKVDVDEMRAVVERAFPSPILI